MRLKKLITNKDQFGYDISLNFSGNGSTFKTPVGGCISILIYIFMAKFVCSLLGKMFIKFDDKLVLTEMKIVTDDVGNNGTVRFNETDLLVFTYFLNASTNEHLYMDDHMLKHVNIRVM